MSDELDMENDLEVETGIELSKSIYPNTTVRMSRGQFSAFQIKRMVEVLDQIKLDPEFQRNPVWKQKQKQELIESILMGIPLPVIYFFEDNHGKKQMVDGRQRVTALIEFMNNDFSLGTLRLLPMFNGKKFKDLEPIYQNKIEDYQISAYVIEPPTPEAVKYDIFDRVNRGGTKLNNQEMRNALYYGKSTLLIKKLSESDEFKKVTGNSIDSRRMKDRYAILRLIGFYLLRRNKLDAEYKSNIDDFLVLVMQHLNVCQDEKLFELERVFLQAMKNAFNTLGGDAFRFEKNNINKRPVNMALFESLGYFFMLTHDSLNDVTDISQKLIILKTKFDDSDAFKYAVDSSKNVDYRFTAIESFILEHY